jgi:hypothetical protein
VKKNPRKIIKEVDYLKKKKTHLNAMLHKIKSSLHEKKIKNANLKIFILFWQANIQHKNERNKKKLMCDFSDFVKMKVALLFFTNLHCSKSKGTCYKE